MRIGEASGGRSRLFFVAKLGPEWLTPGKHPANFAADRQPVPGADTEN
jgi:hypothetical protein